MLTVYSMYVFQGHKLFVDVQIVLVIWFVSVKIFVGNNFFEGSNYMFKNRHEQFKEK